MPCVDHDYKNCPSYMELGEGEKCAQPGCRRQKAIMDAGGALFEGMDNELEDVVVPGKTGGRQGTI